MIPEIAAALAIGSTVVSLDTVADAVSASYNSVKRLLTRKYGSKVSIEGIERNPRSAHEIQLLQTQLQEAGAANDQELLNEIRQLVTLLKQHNPTAQVPGFNIHDVANAFTNISNSTITITGDTTTSQNLSATNQQLVQMLDKKDAQIAKLLEQVLLNPSQQEALHTLQHEKADLENELHQSSEIRQQLQKDKADLERELAPAKEKGELKAKALEEVEKGDYAAAEEHLKEAAKESITETAETFYQLGKIKKLQLSYREALEYFKLATKLDGENNNYLFEAGDIAGTLGYYDDEIAAFEKLLAKANEDKSTKATYLNNIGSAWHSKGDSFKALNYLDKALIICKNVYGEEYHGTAKIYGNIGAVLTTRGEYDKAIRYLKKAVNINNKLYGEEDSKDAAWNNNLGVIWNLKGKFDKALKYFVKALSIDKKLFGEEHPTIATRYNNIATIHYNKDEYDQAIGYFEKALAVLQKFFPPDHPKISICQKSLLITRIAKANPRHSPKSSISMPHSFPSISHKTG